MKRMFVIFIIMIACVGCVQEVSREIEPTLDVVTIVDGTLTRGLHRVVDHDTGVACWVIVDSESVGVHCLPLAETTLDGGK